MVTPDRSCRSDGNPSHVSECGANPRRSLPRITRRKTSGDGPRLLGIRGDYEKVKGAKEWIVLDGSAHAQFLFETDRADRVMRDILPFLSGRPGPPQAR